MTLLEFVLNGPIISYPLPVTVVSDSIGEYFAHFTFSADWTGVKTVVFVDSAGVEDEAVLVDDTCEIPASVMTGSAVYFEVSPYCGNLKTSNSARVPLTASGYRVVTPLPPTDPAQAYILTYTGATGIQIVRNNAGVIEFYSGTTWIVLWESEEEARATAEGLRVLAEIARAEAEAARVTAEGSVLSGRVKAENDRVTAELAREQGETDRDTAYGIAESNRDDQYDAQEAVRDGQYAAQEIVRDGQYTNAEGARDGLYAGREDDRDDLYDIAEAGRSAEQTMQDNLFLALLSDTIRQSAMISRTGTGTKNAIALTNPVSFKDSGAKVEMLGQTLANLFTNGDVSNGTTGWYIPYGGVTEDSVVYHSSPKSLKISAGSAIKYTTQDIAGISGHKYYVSLWLYKVSGTEAIAVVNPYGAVSGALVQLCTTTQFNALSAGVWTKYSGIATATNAGISVFIGRTGTQSFELNIDDVIAIDLTARYGSGNEPTAAQMDLIAPAWFDGTVNVVNPSLRTVGKNHFTADNLIRANGFYNSDGSFTSSPSWDVYKAAVVSELSYVKSGDILATVTFWHDTTFLSGSTSNPVAIPATANYMYLSVTKTNILKLNQQLEPGTVATAYEAHKSNVLSLTETLRSVADTVAVTNETVYTASTWAEWTIAGAGTTKGASGIHLVADGANDYAYLGTFLGGNKKYLLLYNVIATDLNSDFILSNFLTGLTMTLTKTVGNNKNVFTTQATISDNKVVFSTTAGNTNGKYIDFNNVRLVELIPGSQLETDANTLSADQLATNIPYMATTGTATLSTVLRDRLYRQYSKWYIDRYVNPADGLKQTMATENAVVTGVPYIYRDGTSLIETSVIAPLVDSKIPYAKVFNTYVPTLTWVTATPTISSSRHRYIDDGEQTEGYGTVIISDGKGATNVTITLPVPVKVGAGNFKVEMMMKINTTKTEPVVQIIETTNLITFAVPFAMTNGQAAELEYHYKYER